MVTLPVRVHTHNDAYICMELPYLLYYGTNVTRQYLPKAKWRMFPNSIQISVILQKYCFYPHAK